MEIEFGANRILSSFFFLLYEIYARYYVIWNIDQYDDLVIEDVLSAINIVEIKQLFLT